MSAIAETVITPNVSTESGDLINDMPTAAASNVTTQMTTDRGAEPGLIKESWAGVAKKRKPKKRDSPGNVDRLMKAVPMMGGARDRDRPPARRARADAWGDSTG